MRKSQQRFTETLQEEAIAAPQYSGALNSSLLIPQYISTSISQSRNLSTSIPKVLYAVILKYLNTSILHYTNTLMP